MKKQTLILIFLFALSAKAQNFISISGKVTDKQSGKPVSYATISIKNQAIGTVTNTEGAFVFHVPVKYKNDSLVVSSIGYKSYQIKIADIKNGILNIKLEQKVYDLSEVAVKPKNALEIVKQAIAKIPENYPTEPINMDGFYREMTFEKDTCVEMAEAACAFYYRPYGEKYDRNEALSKYYPKNNTLLGNYFTPEIIFHGNITNPDDMMMVKEARASRLHHKYRFKVVPVDGPLGLVGSDLCKNWLPLNAKQYLKKNKFSILNITKYNDKDVYIILVKEKNFLKKSPFTDTLFIDIKTYAIIAYISVRNEYSRKINRYWNPALYNKKKSKCNDVNRLLYHKLTVNYKQTNGKWYLSYIKSEGAFNYIFSKYYKFKKNQPQIKYQLQSELLINNIKTKNVKKIPEKEHFKNQYMNVICDYDLDYNETFWKNYNEIAKTDIQDSIIHQLEIVEPLTEQFKNRLVKNDSLTPPTAMKIPYKNLRTQTVDNYYWMQNIEDDRLLKYVEEENYFTENYMIPLKQLKRDLFFEMIQRINLDTTRISEKIIQDNYEYYYKQRQGANFANIYRKKIAKNAKEELLLDIVKKAQTNPSYWAVISSISPDNSILAFEEPITSGYNSRIVLKDLNTGKNIDSLYKATNIIWTKDKNEFLYLNWNETNRVDKLLKHRIGTAQNNDELIYYEPDKLKDISLKLYQDKYIIMQTDNDFRYNEINLIKLNKKEIKTINIAKQEKGISYFIQIKSDTLYCLVNKADGRSVLYETSMEYPKKEYWKKIISNTGKEFFSEFIILKNYIVILEKENMQSRFRIIDKKGKTIKILKFNNEETYTIGFSSSKHCLENKFRFYYTSLVTPEITYEYDVENEQKNFIKQDNIKGYIAKNYQTKLLWATSKDGEKVPISIAYNKKTVKINGKSPVFLTAYGSYGRSRMPVFSSINLSLLDRGFIYAIAHVRGGNELGAKWHTDAMQMKKKNTFYDFIACAEELIKEKYTTKGRIVALGGSAGGLLMGVVANWKPELFNTIILEVPALDILNSITDSTAKFNTTEKGELGNPENKNVFDYIKSYSPYDNIKAQNYPNMLFITGLNDTRVEYWNAVKEVAKLRALKTDNNTLLLKTDLYAGHNSYSGLYNYLAYYAFEYAFILNNLGIEY